MATMRRMITADGTGASVVTATDPRSDRRSEEADEEVSEAVSLSAGQVESMLEAAVAEIEVPGISVAVFGDGR